MKTVEDFTEICMEIRGAKESELEELIELQRLVFRPDEAAQPRYRAYVREDPTYRLDQSRVVVDGERIVGHLRVWDRLIRVRGAKLRAGGLGGVLTHPAYRGRGYARALMRDTEGYMLEAGYDLGLLFTIIGTAFYRALGWTEIPLPTFEVAVGMEGSGKGEGIRRLEIEEDLEAVAEISRANTEGMTGPEVRRDGYWTWGPSRCRGVFPEWGVEQDGKLAAYVNFEAESDRLWVREACALPGCEAAYGDLALLIVDKTRQQGLATVAGSLPSGHPLVDRLSEAVGRGARWGAHEEMMVKLANWASLAEKLGGAVGNGPPDPEPPFWQALFGLSPAPSGTGYEGWMGSLPPCEGPFYWWSDIF